MRKRYKLLFSALLSAGAAGAGEFDYLNGVSLGQPLPPHAMRFLERGQPEQLSDALLAHYLARQP